MQMEEFEDEYSVESAGTLRCEECGYKWSADRISDAEIEEDETVRYDRDESHESRHCPMCGSADVQTD